MSRTEIITLILASIATFFVCTTLMLLAFALSFTLGWLWGFVVAVVIVVGGCGLFVFLLIQEINGRSV